MEKIEKIENATDVNEQVMRMVSVNVWNNLQTLTPTSSMSSLTVFSAKTQSWTCSSSSSGGEEEEEVLLCFMCGKEGATELKEIPFNWRTMDTFCSPCVAKFEKYIDSKNTDLTHGSPDIFHRDHFERHKRGIEFDDDAKRGKPLTCTYCGKFGDGVVRNYGMYLKYEHRDFCKNDTCCKYYTEYMSGKKRRQIPHFKRMEEVEEEGKTT
jgi:hypothetical protein